VKVALPKILIKAGWQVALENPGADAFRSEGRRGETSGFEVKAPARPSRPKMLRPPKTRQFALKHMLTGFSLAVCLIN